MNVVADASGTTVMSQSDAVLRRWRRRRRKTRAMRMAETRHSAPAVAPTVAAKVC